MALIYEPLQMKGTDPPTFRQVSYSDEQAPPISYWPMCDCLGGHETKEAARACPVALKEMEKVFPPPSAQLPAAIAQVIRLAKRGGSDTGVVGLLEQAEVAARG